MRNLDENRGEVIVGRGEKRITSEFIDKINTKTDKRIQALSRKRLIFGRICVAQWQGGDELHSRHACFAVKAKHGKAGCGGVI